MEFYGRVAELKKLKKVTASKGQSAILIYGRRRVGKSELIKQLMETDEGRSLYYECRQTTEANNVENLSRLISELYHLPPLSFQGIEGALRFLFEKAREEKLILALDEYSYLRDVVKGMDSLLKALLDEFKDKSKLKLILCGSFIDTMKALLEVQNPLYGRIDLSLPVEPMDYYDASLFYPTFSNEDKVRLYSVFGGLPYYNRLIDSNLSVRENIMELIVEDGARLENEVTMNLKSELTKLINANEVFDALAKGYSKFGDILSQSHVTSSPSLSDTLEKLIKMGLIAKRAPINDRNNRKKASYYICDQLSNFYYKYIFRFSSQRSIMKPELFYEKYIEEDFEKSYVPKAFEEIAKQYLIRKNRAGDFPEPFELIGSYYYDRPEERANGEFDVVTKGPKGYIFYEVKFRKARVSQKRIEEEMAEVQKSGLECYKYGFFSRSGYERGIEVENLILIELKDLFA